MTPSDRNKDLERKIIFLIYCVIDDTVSEQIEELVLTWSDISSRIQKALENAGSIVATGNVKFFPIHLMSLWDQFMDCSPLCNPLERRDLLIIALRVLKAGFGE